MSDCDEVRMELLEQTIQADQIWQALASYANSLVHLPGEIQHSPEALQTSRDLLQSCEATSRQLEEARQTLNAAQAHEDQLVCEACRLKNVRTQMEDLNWEIRKQACETYQIWKTMELNCNEQVEQAHLASQVWEVLQVQSECQLFEQNQVTWKAIMTELKARVNTQLAAKTMQAAFDHLDQLQDQYWEHQDEHDRRIGAAWNAWYDASLQAQQAHHRLLNLQAQLEMVDSLYFHADEL